MSDEGRVRMGFPNLGWDHSDWCDANGCRCGKCPCLGEPSCTPPVAAAPAPTADPHRLVDKWTGEPCPTRGKLLCTIPQTPTSEHRHVSAHMWRPAAPAPTDLRLHDGGCGYPDECTCEGR